MGLIAQAITVATILDLSDIEASTVRDPLNPPGTDMTDSSNWWTATGSTPREAVEALVPTPGQDGVAWVEGIHMFSDRAAPEDHTEPIRREVTVIYDSPPTEQWQIVVEPEETAWLARFVGGKKIHEW